MNAPADALALLRDLARREVTLSVAAGRLRVRAPVGALAAADREALAAARGALVVTLATHACTDCGRFSFARPVRCYWCRRGRR